MYLGGKQYTDYDKLSLTITLLLITSNYLPNEFTVFTSSTFNLVWLQLDWIAELSTWRKGITSTASILQQSSVGKSHIHSHDSSPPNASSIASLYSSLNVLPIKL